MSKKNIHAPIYITVEPTTKSAKLLIGRLSNYFVLFALLVLNKWFAVPESVFIIFACTAIGLEAGTFINLLKRGK